MITCWRCGSKNITHFRQIIAGGKAVVTARCENGHIPEKGKPFYPKYLFDIDKLPALHAEEKDEQPELFKQDETPMSLIDYVEQKRNWRFGK